MLRGCCVEGEEVVKLYFIHQVDGDKLNLYHNDELKKSKYATGSQLGNVFLVK